MKIIKNLILIALFVALIGANYYLYLHYSPTFTTAFLQAQKILFPAKPCEKPITYSIGSFDDRFHISRDEFIAIINEAAATWENSAHKKLFTYSPDGAGMKINLIYDYRQQATDKLRGLGIAIEDDQQTYNTLKNKYDSLNEQYQTQKKKIDNQYLVYQKAKLAYQSNVDYWTVHSNITPTEYKKLEAERVRLNAQAEDINKQQAELKNITEQINTVVTVINPLGRRLNINVSNYNSIGEQTGQEFDEGIYKSAPEGQEIDIYQFDTKNQLLRVMIHEMGHALGLEHIENPQSIMYQFNQDKNIELTNDDIAALKNICHIQ